MKYPLKSAIQRSVRVALSALAAGVIAGLTMASVTKIDLSDPKAAMNLLTTAFVAGFISGLAKYLREMWDTWRKLPL